MSDFIEEFYYGNIEPQECTTNLTSKVRRREPYTARFWKTKILTTVVKTLEIRKYSCKFFLVIEGFFCLTKLLAPEIIKILVQ